jgi:hypothetical protein
MASLNTVNVIEYASGSVQQIFSYENNIKGVKEAEKIFVLLAAENGMDKEDTDVCLDDGLYEQGDYQVFIVHSIKYQYN